MNTTLTFETKEQYLTWRAEWRTRYAEISKHIHDLKLVRRSTASGIGRDKWASQREKIAEIIKRFTGPYGFDYGAIWRFQNEAREMLELRKASKLRAQEQYLKAHQTSSTPA